MKLNWQNPEFRERIDLKPNGFEREFLEYFPMLQYVGDFSFWVGTKNPDFILPDSQKCVDLWGDYWHDGDDPKDRVEYFNDFEYDLIVIWQSEWESHRDKVIDQVENFLNEDWIRVGR